MTPLQSPQYAALVAAKEARDTAYATLSYFERKVLEVARSDGDIASVRDGYRQARTEADAAGELVEALEVVFNTAYPAPTEVVDAATAAQVARAELVRIGNELADSYTPAQLDLMNAKDNAQAALDAAVTVAKALIEAAQVSPCKAFVVRSSTKMVTDNMGAIEEAIFGDDLPSDLLAVDQKALQKYMSEHPLRAEAYQVKFEQSVSVAFYAAKL